MDALLAILPERQHSRASGESHARPAGLDGDAASRVMTASRLSTPGVAVYMEPDSGHGQTAPEPAPAR